MTPRPTILFRHLPNGAVFAFVQVPEQDYVKISSRRYRTIIRQNRWMELTIGRGGLDRDCIRKQELE